MKIEVTRAFYLGGQPQPVGTTLDVEDRLARELIHAGKARTASEKPAPARPAPKKEPKE